VKRKSIWTLILIFCAASLAPAQDLSARSSPKKQAIPAAPRSTLLNQSVPTAPGRFRGWRHTQPGTLPHQGNKSRVVAPSGRVAASRRKNSSSNQTTPPFNGFGFRPDLPAGRIPTAVAAADFNGDGKLDWAVSNGEDNTIWIYLGNGDGTSALPTILPVTGVSPTWLVQADLNGDGKPDLIVAEADSSTVGVFLGNGDGTFKAEVQYSVPAPPLYLVAGDFTGDGKVDIAVGMIGSTATGSVAVLPGDGKGHLGAALYTPDPFPSTGYWLTPAKLRGNGELDLIVVDPDDFGPHGGVQVYLNNGNGTFAPGQFVYGNEAIPDEPPDLMMSAAVGSLSSGACNSLVVTDSYGLAFIFSGNCDGTFSYPPVQFAIGDMGATVQLADVNGDGILDFVASGAVLPGSGGQFGNVAGDEVLVLLGDGSGNFGQSRTYRGDMSMYSLAIGDVNGDGFPDLISANQGSNTASVFLNDGKGGFGDPQGEGFGNNNGATNAPDTPFAFADVDGNGTIDMVILNSGPYPGNPNQINTFLNDGTGRFSAPITTPAWPSNTTYFPGGITLADFRNTGRPDLLIVANPYTPAVMYYAPNIGGGQFGNYTMTTPAGAAGPIAVGDFNGDGKLDFVTASMNLTINPSEQLNVFLGNGDGTFRTGQTITFSNGDVAPVLAFTGDFNGDGKLDVMVWDDGLYEFFGNGDGTFQAGIPLFGNLGGGLVMADFNHDGFPDIMTVSDAYGFATDAIFSVYLGQPDGSFQFSASYNPYPYFFDGPGILDLVTLMNPFPGIVGDFNGDGNPDVLVFPFLVDPYLDPAIQILYGNGDGTFTPTYVNYPLYKEYCPEFAVDLNGDGRSDLVELDNYSASFNVIKSTAGGPAVQLDLLTAPLTGTTGTGRVILNTPSATPTSVSFVTSDPSVAAASMTIPAGSVSQDFTFTVGSGFNHLKVFSIEAQVGSATATAYDYFSGPPLPVIEFTPPKLFFPGVVADGSGSTLPVIVKNVGAGILTVSQIQMQTYFTQTNDCSSGLSQGESCTIKVTFTPYGPGDQQSAMGVQDNVSGVYGFVATEGVGISPLQISPCCLGLSSVVGGTSAPQAITLSNVGTIPIQVSSVVPNESVVAQTNNCSTIAAGGNCQINVTFSPTSEGAVTGILTLSTNIPNETPFYVSFSGNAGDFSLGTAAPITVSRGGSATYQLSATSSGGFSGNVSLACGRAPSGVACSINPSSVNLAADGTSPYTVTVTTTGGNAALTLRSTADGKQRSMPFIAFLGLVLVVLCIEIKTDRVGRNTIRAAWLCLAFLLVSCGGAGSGGTSGTQPVSYTLTITGTVDSASHTTSVTLNVQ
jgi:FG-GAP-like repeat/Abnormal spindle-like microcephaly-assoc'd, ASPM-SPD-2-Hydin